MIDFPFRVLGPNDVKPKGLSSLRNYSRLFLLIFVAFYGIFGVGFAWMRAAARVGEFLRRKRSVVGLFPGCTIFSTNSGSFSSLSGAAGGRLRKVWDCDGRELGFRRIPSFGVGSLELFFERSHSGAAQVLAADMEATSGGDPGVLLEESAESLKALNTASGVGSNGVASNGTMVEGMVVDRIAQGEGFRNDLVPETPGISSASVREEVELAVEAEGMKELVEGAAAEDGNLAKRLKVEAAVADLPHVAKAWEHWNKLGAPKLMVAPMVDQSELPFRMLCRKYGATAAYSPMLHSRLFAEDAKYRTKEFSTCPVSEIISFLRVILIHVTIGKVSFWS